MPARNRRPALSAAVLALTAGGLWWWQARRTANAAPNYSTQAVARGNLTLTVTANGTLQPTRSTNIGSELSGTVLKVNVDVNDLIRKGQARVELDTAKLRDQILRSRAVLAAATAKVTQTLTTVKEATADLARLEEVARISAGQLPAGTELDTGHAALERATADAASARAGVSDAQAALALDEINLSKASIRAPSDGVVLTRTVDTGNAVAASLQRVRVRSVIAVARFLKWLPVRAVWCEMFLPDHAWSRPRLILATETDLSARQVVEIYAERRGIEPLFHHLKRWWGVANLWQQSKAALELWMQI
ncbi:MAG TPA: transposase, partial [Accumulibacter sp.]